MSNKRSTNSDIEIDESNMLLLLALFKDSTTDWEAVYRFKAERGFQGTTHVELKIEKGSEGTRASKNIRLINLEIMVQ